MSTLWDPTSADGSYAGAGGPSASHVRAGARPDSREDSQPSPGGLSSRPYGPAVATTEDGPAGPYGPLGQRGGVAVQVLPAMQQTPCTAAPISRGHRRPSRILRLLITLGLVAYREQPERPDGT